MESQHATLPVFVSGIEVKSRSFSLFQASMDLPPDKAKLLKQYDNEKKWDIICDQVSIARDPSSIASYLRIYTRFKCVISLVKFFPSLIDLASEETIVYYNIYIQAVS